MEWITKFTLKQKIQRRSNSTQYVADFMKKMITIEDIETHKDANLSKQKVRDIESRIEGRIMSTPNKAIGVLYVLAKLMGSKLQNYVELGLLHGGSMTRVKMALGNKKNGKIIGVDLFEGFDRKAHIDPISKMEITNQVASRNLNIFPGNKSEISFIKGDAIEDSVVSKIGEITNKKIDLLFIDCDFKKENVIKMFKDYGKIVSTDGVIVFGNYKRDGYDGVAQAIDEISFNGWEEIGKYKMYYIIQKKSSRGRPQGSITATSVEDVITRQLKSKAKKKAKSKAKKK